jgi:hydrogenase maturation factor HypF (carbamoyltransferase family)
VVHVYNELNVSHVYSGNFSREDLAAAWLQYVVDEFCQVLSLIRRSDGIKRVFICGGFVAHPVVRHFLTKELAGFNMFNSQLHQVNLQNFLFIIIKA